MKRIVVLSMAGLMLSAASARAQAQREMPGPGPERTFLLAQLLRAVDEKVSLLLEQGTTEEALAEMQQALEVEVPRHHPAYEMRVHLAGRLAMTYAEAGRTDEAVKTVATLLADVPRGTPVEATAYLNAGLVYRRVGMNDEALKAFDRAIEISKKLAEGGRRPLPGPPGGGRPRPPTDR